MIREHAIRQHSAAPEILLHPHEHQEMLPLCVPEHKAPIHHPRNAVVNRQPHRRILPRCQKSCTSHSPSLSTQVPKASGSYQFVYHHGFICHLEFRRHKKKRRAEARLSEYISFYKKPTELVTAAAKKAKSTDCTEKCSRWFWYCYWCCHFKTSSCA